MQAILVYDITKKETFEKIQNYWLQEVKKNIKNKKIVLALAANKSDLYEKRVVKKEEAEDFARNNVHIYEEIGANNFAAIII